MVSALVSPSLVGDVNILKNLNSKILSFLFLLLSAPLAD